MALTSHVKYCFPISLPILDTRTSRQVYGAQRSSSTRPLRASNCGLDRKRGQNCSVENAELLGCGVRMFIYEQDEQVATEGVAGGVVQRGDNPAAAYDVTGSSAGVKGQPQLLHVPASTALSD